MSKRVFLVHGWDGNPNNCWFPWLKKELGKRNFHAEILDMPKNARLNDWLNSVKEAVKKADKDTYFIGHSLGCLAILHYLEKLKPDEKVGGCIFVAGFAEDIGIPEIKEFYNKKLNFGKIKAHAEKFMSILSDNDYVVPLKSGLQLQKKLKAGLIIENRKGHFNAQDGVTELESALDDLIKMAGER